MPIAVASPIVDDVRALFTLDHDALQDPYPLYARMREEAPIMQYDPTTIIVSRYRDAKPIYLDYTHFPNSEERGVRFSGKLDLLSEYDRELLKQTLDFERHFTTNMNGTEHRRVRRAAGRAFTPRRIASLEPKVAEIADQLLAGFGPDDTVDLMDLASRLPLFVIMDMLGVPRADAAMLKEWSVNINIARTVLLPENVKKSHDALAAFRAYVADLVDQHRKTGGVEGLVNDLLGAEKNERVTDEEVLATFVHFLFAGHETTTGLIGNGMRALLSHRGEWAKLVADPDLATQCVEEVLRWDSPVQFFQRIAGEGAVLGGDPVPEGSFVILMNAAANRDPDICEDPERFDISRKPVDHLSFGHGPHFCLGAPVARLEGRILLAKLARDYPDIAPAVDLDTVEIIPNMSLRCPKTFQVKLGKKATH